MHVSDACPYNAGILQQHQESMVQMTKLRHKKSSKKRPAKRRPRRSAEEITLRLVDAAIQEFALNGYAGTRTAAIARRAGVVEPLLFKYFGSKANLFQRAVFQTLDRFYSNFVADHPFDTTNSAEWAERSREYIGAQQDFLRKNSRMFMSLIVHETFNTAEIEGIEGLSGLLVFLDKVAKVAETGRTIDADTDPKLIARISFALLLACVLFHDWLFPKGLASDRKIRAAVIDFVFKGADMGKYGSSPASTRV